MVIFKLDTPTVMRHLLCLWLLMLCTAQCDAQMQDSIVVPEMVSVKQFKHKGDDSGYVVRDSVIVGFIGKYVQRDWTYKYKGHIQNLDRTYYNIYDRTKKQVAIVEQERYHKNKHRVRIHVLNSDKTFSFGDVTEDKVLPTVAKLLLANNILW